MRESVLVSVLLLGQLGSVLLGTLWEHAEDPPPQKMAKLRYLSTVFHPSLVEGSLWGHELSGISRMPCMWAEQVLTAPGGSHQEEKQIMEGSLR